MCLQISSIWESVRTPITRKYFSPECILKCLFRCPPSEKAFEHLLQRNGVLKCIFKYPTYESEKSLGQLLQGNGFSPECVLKCLFNYRPSEKSLGHRLQGNVFLPECVLKCTFKCPSCNEMVFHLNVFLSVSSNFLHFRKI